MKNSGLIKPPDGGWGWMACLGSSLITFSLRALDPSFGLVFHDFLINLDADSTETSLITSIYDANMNFSGLFVGALLKKFSYRKVAFVGASISSIGLIFTSRARSVTQILCTYSVLAAVGTGLATAAGFVALNNYFDKKRGQAVGFSMVGTAVAMMLMPQLAHALLDAYEFRGTMLIIGGWAMHALIGACLLRPVRRKHVKPLTIKVIKNEPTESNVEDKGSKRCLESEELLKHLIETDDDKIKDVSETINPTFENEEKSDKGKKNFGWLASTVQAISNFVDLQLLKNSMYLNVIIGLSLFNVAEVNFKLMAPFFLRSVGMTKGEIASCLSLMALTDIAARLILPLIYDKIGASRRRIFWITSLLVGICRSILAERTKGFALIVVLTVIGFIRGAAVLNLNLSVSESCSLQQLPHAYGLFMVSKGIFSLTLSPLIGLIRDYSGSYKICIHAMTVLIFLAFASWSMEFFCNAINRRKNRIDIDGTEKISIDCSNETASMEKQVK